MRLFPRLAARPRENVKMEQIHSPQGSDIALVIPVHRQQLTPLEVKRVSVSLEHSPKDSSYFVGPSNLDFTSYKVRWPWVGIATFDPLYFRGKKSYSDWLLQSDLYDRFQEFTFIVICQTDAILIRELSTSQWRFDYIGAPWDPAPKIGWNPITRRLRSSRFTLARKEIVVGNGGLSARRTRAFQEFTRIIEAQKNGYSNEDATISYFGGKFGLKLASPEQAGKTFMETSARYWRPGDDIPDVDGFHALDVFNPDLERHLLEIYGA